MSRRLFITGTDTGVGKTAVASGLVRVAAASGLRVIGLKPIASGAEHTPDGPRNEDALALAAESTVQLPCAPTNPLCFEPAVTPHIAAAEAGVAIVEGAGGWRGRVP